MRWVVLPPRWHGQSSACNAPSATGPAEEFAENSSARTAFYLGSRHKDGARWGDAVAADTTRIAIGEAYRHERLLAYLCKARCERMAGDVGAAERTLIEAASREQIWAEYWMELAYIVAQCRRGTRAGTSAPSAFGKPREVRWLSLESRPCAIPRDNCGYVPCTSRSFDRRRLSDAPAVVGATLDLPDSYLRPIAKTTCSHKRATNTLIRSVTPRSASWLRQPRYSERVLVVAINRRRCHTIYGMQRMMLTSRYRMSVPPKRSSGKFDEAMASAMAG